MKIFDINSLDQWRDAFNSFPESSKEVYFAPEYYLNWLQHEQAAPICFYEEIDGVKFLYPFYLKEIEGFDLDKPYFDISTAYGYGGVLTDKTDISDAMREQFNTVFNAWCEENAIVAEFIREIPYVNNKIRDAKYQLVRNNVYIELDTEYEIKNRHLKKNINKAKRHGLRYEWDPEMTKLDSHIKLYSRLFERIDMDDYYLFSKDYYIKLKELFPGQYGLINVYYNDEIINSMIVFHSYKKLVCHLIGTNYDFIDFRPNDFIYLAAIEIAKKLGVNLISMGGGKTLDDNLFRFKNKFGNCVKEVFVGKRINNQDIYTQLIEQWEEKYPENRDRFKNFFLRYRLIPG